MAPPILRPPEPPTEELLRTFAAIRLQQHVPPAFPPAVEEAAAAAARRAATADRRDLRGTPFVTIDPPGSLDLDQAVFTERRDGGGWRVHYAIADVAAFVDPGDAVDVEARERGVTLYSPDLKTPLHPTALSEHAGSLRPDDDRPAIVWRIELDGEGAVTGDPVVERAVVRSRARLDYPSVQAALDADAAAHGMDVLREVGEARIDQERRRGGVSLDLPDQQVVHEDGHYRLAYRRPLPVEGWNAQVSLLTGITAAGIMVRGGVGLLRTLPPPPRDLIAAIRRSARALGIAVADDATYPDIVRAADASTDAGAALLNQAARALRGAGYEVLDGTAHDRATLVHAAIASTYAHVTAPLRRLADRFANEVVLALAAGHDVPGWVVEALPAMPQIMGAAHERDGTLARAMVDAVEALVLRDRVGEVFRAVITNVDDRGGVVQIRDPAVLARVGGIDGSRLGHEVDVRLDAVDVQARKLTLSLVSSAR